MSLAEDLGTFQEFALGSPLLKLLGAEKVVLYPVQLTWTRRTRCRRDAKAQPAAKPAQNLANHGRFTHTGGPGDDDKLAGEGHGGVSRCGFRGFEARVKS